MSALAPRCALVLLLAALAPRATAEPPVIPDGPVTIDPAQFLPEPLRAKATVDFTESSLRELVAWLRDEQGLSVVVHEREILDELDLSLSDRVSDRLDDAPLYHLLDRLAQFEIAWWYEGDVLHLATEKESDNRLVVATYPIGDLIDAGLDADSIINLLTATIAADTWADNGGGEAELLQIGDLLFVTQRSDVQRNIAALLQGLRTHGRRTWISEPAEHETLRAKVDQSVTADFDGTPLVEAVADLASQVGARIQLDRPALRDIGIRPREPVRLRLADQPLGVVLQAMLSDLDLTCVPRGGVLLVTTEDESNTDLPVAVYDVRDLCRDLGEFESLIDAIMSAVAANTWAVNGGGEAEICVAPPGALVISQTEPIHDEVLRLLEMYREALRNSKPRKPVEEEDPNEVMTVYYRLHRETAEDVVGLLSSLTDPDAWDDKSQVLCVASNPEYTKPQKGVAPIERPYSVLIVRQKRAVHDEIRKVLDRIAGGDPAPGNGGAFGSGGLGGGGGGFGGGFFSVED